MEREAKRKKLKKTKKRSQLRVQAAEMIQLRDDV